MRITRRQIFTFLFFAVGITGVLAAVTITKNSQDLREQAAYGEVTDCGGDGQQPCTGGGCKAGYSFSTSQGKCVSNGTTLKKADGSLCNSGDGCSSGSCVNGKCVAKVPSNTGHSNPCGNEGQSACKPSIFTAPCSNGTVEVNGKCVAKNMSCPSGTVKIGNDCINGKAGHLEPVSCTDVACGPNDKCSNGKCVTKDNQPVSKTVCTAPYVMTSNGCALKR